MKVDPNHSIGPHHNRHGKVNPENHFPIILMNILGDVGLSKIISWIPSSSSAHNDSSAFVIRDKHKFARVVMPRFFKKGTKYSSFARRMKRWSFFHQSISGSSIIYSHSMFVKGNRSLCLLMRPKPQVSYKKDTRKAPERNPRNPKGPLRTTKRSNTVAPAKNYTAALIGASGGILDDASLLPTTVRGSTVPCNHGNSGGWSTAGAMTEADYSPPANLLTSAYSATRLSSSLASQSRQAVDRNAGLALLADTASSNVGNRSSTGAPRPSGALGKSSTPNFHELQQTQANRDITRTCQTYSRFLPFHPRANDTLTQPSCNVGMLTSRFDYHQEAMHFGSNGNANSIYFGSNSSSAPLLDEYLVLPPSSNGSIYDDQVTRCRSLSLAGATTYLPLHVDIGKRTLELGGILEQNLIEREGVRHRQNQRIGNYDCFSLPRTGAGDLSSWL